MKDVNPQPNIFPLSFIVDPRGARRGSRRLFPADVQLSQRAGHSPVGILGQGKNIFLTFEKPLAGTLEGERCFGERRGV